MLDSFIVITSALLGAMSCLFYFYLNRRSFQLWRGNVQTELEAAQEQLVEDLRRVDVSQLQSTRAGQELFQILQQDRLLPLAKFNALPSITQAQIIGQWIKALQEQGVALSSEDIEQIVHSVLEAQRGKQASSYNTSPTVESAPLKDVSKGSI